MLMNKPTLLKNISKYVKEKMSEEATGHDFFHAQRVLKNALIISITEKNVDLFILQAAALMHDLGDWKVNESEKTEKEILKDTCTVLSIPEVESEKIIEIILNMSFSANVVERKKLSIEGKIVQDADRLDAIGAIGIARVFAYGAKRGKVMHDPSIKPVKHATIKSYRYAKSTTVNHFYEKLFLLKDLMNTKKGKQMAVRREKFMKRYLEELYKEWDCE